MVRAVQSPSARPALPGQFRASLRCIPLLLATAMLAACLQSGTVPPDPAPERSTAPDVSPIRPAVMAPATEESQIRAYFAALEAQRLSQGLLRRERVPGDLPISPHLIEDVFVRVALHQEYVLAGGQVIERKTASSLRRWQDPVTMQLSFGESVPDDIRSADTVLVSRFAARLADLTGHPVSRVERGGNFHVLVLDEDERRASGPRLQRLIPGLDSVTLDLVRDLPLSVSCLVIAFSRSGTHVYTDALAIIRAELPDLSRRACYYEELAQGMGLPNDSPRARPSLFNDSAEFAVLTVLDEQLLRVLYDPRLQPGMRAPEARPIIRRIASELMAGES